MMKNIIIILIVAFISIITFSIIIDPALFFNNVIQTLNIWLYKVYPSIFTFYILASLFINSKLINKVIYLLKPLLKHLKFRNENTLHLFILSVFIGNPSSASLICEAIDKKNINVDDANLLLKCSSFINPLFIVSFMLSFNIEYAFIVIMVHILSNFIIALILNRKNNNTIIHNSSINFLLEGLLKSVNNVIYLLLMISGIMVFCNIFKYSVITLLNYFDIYNLIFEILLINIEISLGLHSLLSLGLSEYITLMLVCFVCSFSGISIHLQVFNVISRYKLKYLSFFKYRIIQGIIAILLFTFFYYII